MPQYHPLQEQKYDYYTPKDEYIGTVFHLKNYKGQVLKNQSIKLEKDVLYNEKEIEYIFRKAILEIDGKPVNLADIFTTVSTLTKNTYVYKSKRYLLIKNG